MITIYTAHYHEPIPEQRHLTEHALGLALLSEGLSELYGISVSSDRLPSLFAHGTYGKPYLKDYPSIHFNVSHCRSLVVCAFSDAPVGIDAEHIRPFREHLLRKVLSSSEQDILNRFGTSEAARQEWFFRFWTLKESCIKQSGTGMASPLTDFSFSFDDGVKADPLHGPTAADNLRIRCSLPGLFFRQWLSEDGYVLSVCTSLEDETFRLITADPSVHNR